MIFCRFCGTENIDVAVYCKKCGKQIVKEPSITTSTTKDSVKPETKSRQKKSLSWIVGILSFIVLAGLIIGAFFVFDGKMFQKPIGDRSYNTNTLAESRLQIELKTFPEVYPVVANLLASGNTRFPLPPIVKWQITNSYLTSQTVILETAIPGWTDSEEITTVEIGPLKTVEIDQNLFGQRMLNNIEITPANILAKTKVGNTVIFQESRKINIRDRGDMVWSLSSYDTAYLIAAWVTPRDPKIEQIFAYAKLPYGVHFNGYQDYDKNPRDINGQMYRTKEQARAIFNAFRDAGVSYVNSPITFGEVGGSQRVRLPRESLIQRSANCIDGTVLLASLYENIGLEPLIVLKPGHAFVGVRYYPGSQETLFIETTLLDRDPLESLFTLTYTFDAAVQAGNAKFGDGTGITIVDIKKAREWGIYPLDLP